MAFPCCEHLFLTLSDQSHREEEKRDRDVAQAAY